MVANRQKLFPPKKIVTKKVLAEKNVRDFFTNLENKKYF